MDTPLIGSYVYFTGWTDANGSEPWITDGTAAGTRMLANIGVGAGGDASGNSNPGRAYRITGTDLIVYAAYDGPNGVGTELYASNIITGGATLLADIRPGAGLGGTPTSYLSFGAINGKVVFAGNAPDAGTGLLEIEPWITDGTPGGTFELKDINPNAMSAASPSQFTSLGIHLFFRANEGVSTNLDLWKTDGTAAGTVKVKDFSATLASDLTDLTAVNNKLYFRANDGTGTGLWASDGSEAGTFKLGAVVPASILPNVPVFVALGDKVLFAGTGSNGTELWITDGTVSGTSELKDILPGATGSGANEIARIGGKAVFRADDGINGVELWVTDGTAAGTMLLKDINPTGSSMAAGSNPSGFLTELNGKVLFRADDGANGAEVWVTDGTAAGTFMLKDIYGGATGSSSASNGHFVRLDDKLVFQAASGADGTEMWVTDGTAAGTTQIASVRPGAADGATSSNAMASITNNVGPSITTNTGLTVSAGGTGTITAAQLASSDSMQSATQLTYTIVDVSSGGSVRLNGSDLSLNGTFTQADIDAGLVTFASNGTGAGATTAFRFDVRDNVGGEVNYQAFTIQVQPVAAPPVLGVNAGSTVLEGGTDIVTASELDYNDADTPDTAITYTITSATTNGKLYRNGSALGVGGTFSQADINNNLISYSHNGSETSSDSVGFSVTDGTTNLSNQSLTFTVTAVNDAPVNAPGSALSIREDGPAIPITGISIADPDAGSAGIQVTLSVAHGTLTLSTSVAGGIVAGQISGGANGSATITITATQAEINATLGDVAGLAYRPNTNFNGNDAVTIATSDLGNVGGAPLTDTDTKLIIVTPVNDAPSGADFGLTLASSGSRTFAPADFGFSDVDGHSLQAVIITTLPTIGTLRLNGAPVTSGQVIAASDLANLRFDAGHSSGPGGFTFQVRDTGGTLDGGVNTDPTANTITISVQPAPPPVVVPDPTPTPPPSTGTPGNDLLIGTVGPDTLSGGPGDDVYVVGSEDIVVESEGDGNDLVYTPGSYALPAGSEIEILSSQTHALTNPINLTGNEFSQTLIGNYGNNVLFGGGGSDTLIGLDGNDLYIVGEGTVIQDRAGGGDDLLYASSSYALTPGAEIETISTRLHSGTEAINLTGNEFSQTIIGNYGKNLLYGGSGADTLIGLAGDDVYVVSDTRAQILDSVGSGNDLVYTSVSYGLAQGAEIETLSTQSHGGTDAIDLTGNGFAQTIIGNFGANVLAGGGGSDTLHGLGGADTFLMNSAPGAGSTVTIADFIAGEDRIALSSRSFGGLSAGPLSANNFVAGVSAADADDRIIYDAAAGQLLYDADGNGVGAAILFASIAPGTPLALADLSVVP